MIDINSKDFYHSMSATCEDLFVSIQMLYNDISISRKDLPTMNKVISNLLDIYKKLPCSDSTLKSFVYSDDTDLWKINFSTEQK